MATLYFRPQTSGALPLTSPGRSLHPQQAQLLALVEMDTVPDTSSPSPAGAPARTMKFEVRPFSHADDEAKLMAKMARTTKPQINLLMTPITRRPPIL